MTLEEIRENIDRLDGRIVKLLNDRMEQALLAGRLKDQIEDSERERQVLERLRGRATDLIHPGFVARVYGDIMEESKTLQQKKRKLGAFQGEHGAYSEVAARAWDPELIPMPCPEFTDLFTGVEEGLYDFGLVPVENTLGGPVGPVNDLLIGTELRVAGAVELPVRHCLLAPPGADHRGIRRVYSHPQALAQCRRFLARNKLEPVRYHDTAGAARMIADKRPGGAAAIGSALCAGLYDLEILKEGIEDHERNLTRFLVLSREDNREAGEKCSILFSTAHKAGTLFRVLEVFARQGLNLTRIESVPEEPGTYAFFLDFVGSIQDPPVRKAIEAIKGITTRFKLLGCYLEKRVS
ncbi:MAG: bifunctional chorismate mutase/prephenate dehydratase [Desulfobacterota bacterium]|nr:bifunctional chorismate mutase/prephenate dehydratase [Thermodesulfobacteriota bacterium]